jgi:K(+)-stimulated pyrophosphate-energized sodium pump
MGMFQNNAGGAWDNAKKSFEKGVEINGQILQKIRTAQSICNR